MMAEDRSNAGVAHQLRISERTIEAACAQLFQKLDHAAAPCRGVLAVRRAGTIRLDDVPASASGDGAAPFARQLAVSDGVRRCRCSVWPVDVDVHRPVLFGPGSCRARTHNAAELGGRRRSPTPHPDVP
jgi:Bacterial regulatory proteins, luxR family